MYLEHDSSPKQGAQALVSLCEYGGNVVAEVTASAGFAPVFVEMLELLFGDTHYAVLEQVDGWLPGAGGDWSFA